MDQAFVECRWAAREGKPARSAQIAISRYVIGTQNPAAADRERRQALRSAFCPLAARDHGSGGAGCRLGLCVQTRPAALATVLAGCVSLGRARLAAE
jgi:hypothetical protein